MAPQYRCRSLLRTLRLLRLLADTGREWSWYELADALSVSTRTVRRDIEVLREAGLFTIKRQTSHADHFQARLRWDGPMMLNWQDHPAGELVIAPGIAK